MRANQTSYDNDVIAWANEQALIGELGRCRISESIDVMA